MTGDQADLVFQNIPEVFKSFPGLCRNPQAWITGIKVNLFGFFQPGYQFFNIKICFVKKDDGRDMIGL